MSERNIEENGFNGYEWGFRERSEFKDGYEMWREENGDGYEISGVWSWRWVVSGMKMWRKRERSVVYGSERNEFEMGMEIAVIQVQNFLDSISY